MTTPEPQLQPRLERILVPLDGSGLAEAALAPATEIARDVGASVVLLHVLEREAPATVHGERHLRTRAEAERYLADVAERLTPEGVEVEAHVHTPAIGDVAASLAQHAHEIDADLIALCTHGSGGLRDLLIGSIPQQTLKLATRPVLVVRPAATGGPRVSIGESCLGGGVWVVALDPMVHGTTALPLAGVLARACDARLHLVAVVPTLARLPAERAAGAIFTPSATASVLELEAEDTRGYVEQVAESLRDEGLEVTSELRRGDAAEQITAAVSADRARLLVIATHGHAGVSGRLSGSFAAAVVPRLATPLLLVPIEG